MTYEEFKEIDERIAKGEIVKPQEFRDWLRYVAENIPKKNRVFFIDPAVIHKAELLQQIVSEVAKDDIKDLPGIRISEYKSDLPGQQKIKGHFCLKIDFPKEYYCDWWAMARLKEALPDDGVIEIETGDAGMSVILTYYFPCVEEFAGE